MNYVIKTGKSVDEAVREALTELNINKEDANIQILDEGQKGFLVVIKLTKKVVSAETIGIISVGSI